MQSRLIKIHEVLHRCSFSRSTLYRLIEKKEFPVSRQISPSGRAVAWLESDIEKWIVSRVKN